VTASSRTVAPGDHFDFRTTDPARAIDHLNNAYRTKLRVSGARDGYVFRHQRADAGPFALDKVRLPLDLLIQQAPMDSLVILRIDAGRIERACVGISERFIEGDVFVDAEPGLPATLHMLDTDLDVVMLDLGLLAEVAAASPTRTARQVRLTSYQPKSAAAALRWQRTIVFLRELLADSDTVAQPLIRGNAARLLAATVLATFPNNAVTDPMAQDRRDATSATLRRAIAFIEEFAQTDIGVVDIAAAANVSIRAAQFAFRRHLDTTPMAYLRGVRLAQAHRDLVVANPGRGDSVTSIAARWGFYSPSRFAAQYRKAYGVTPRHTLHR
jgi:AraC-like DNA-binding protein